MDVDSVFRVIGELGRQQLVYVAYLLMLNTYAAFHMIQVPCTKRHVIHVLRLSSFIANLVYEQFYVVSCVALYPLYCFSMR